MRQIMLDIAVTTSVANGPLPQTYYAGYSVQFKFIEDSK